MSGRHAVCVSRHVGGARGFYTLVYDDVEGSPLLAYFTPTGKACCYYPTGAIRMLCDKEGGSLFNEVNSGNYRMCHLFITFCGVVDYE